MTDLRYVATATIAAAVLAAACSSSGGNTKDSTSTTASHTTPAPTTSSVTSTAVSSVPVAAGTGACKYVSVAQASQLAASPVKAGTERSLASGPVTFKYCDFIFDPGNAPGVSIAVADLNGAGASLFGQFRASKQTASDFQDVPGVGDAAFYADENLNVLKGDTGVILYVGRANGSPRGPAGIPDEKQLAAIVLPQL